MRILFLTDYLPFPPISGDRIRVYNLIRRIARHHQVSLISFLQTPDDIVGVSHLMDFCCRVEAVRLQRNQPISHLPGLLRHSIAGIPLELKFLHSSELISKLLELFSKEDFDILQIEHSRMAFYLDALPQSSQIKKLLVFHNVTSHQYNRIFRIEQTPIKRIRSWLYGFSMRKWEPRIAERFDRCISVSNSDRDLLLKVNPRLQIDVVPNGVDTQIFQPLSLESLQPILLLIGNMSYLPCADGAIWFCKEILPRIRRVVGEVQVWIVGVSPPPEVVSLNGNGVHVTGQVEDVIPYYRQSAISIVPLRAGGGTRLKILEAMALGRPVVSTTIGCEGLDVNDEEHLLLADNPERFADQTISLLKNKDKYHHLRILGRQLVEAHYSWDRISEKQMQIYQGLLS